jgi:RNA polymerase sigma factor (sigma-70 family)
LPRRASGPEEQVRASRQRIHDRLCVRHGRSGATFSGISSLVSGIATTYLLSFESLSHEPASQEELPVDTLIREENRERLHPALARLPKRNREVLQAYYFEDLSLEEIGRRHGLSKSWLSRIHARSIQLLREAMASEPDELRAIVPPALPKKQTVCSQL